MTQQGGGKRKRKNIQSRLDNEYNITVKNPWFDFIALFNSFFISFLNLLSNNIQIIFYFLYIFIQKIDLRKFGIPSVARVYIYLLF